MAPSSGRWHRGRGQSSYRGNRNDNNRYGAENGGGGRGRGHRGIRQTERPPMSDNQRAFTSWRHDIPHSEHGRPLFYEPLSPDRLASFMQDAQRLIELRDDEIRQEVITKLASEGGLMRIAELVRIDLRNLKPDHQKGLLEGTVLPFLRTITHADVLSSLLLEQAVGNIFVFLYGTSGRRAIHLFECLIDVLKNLMTDHSADKIRPSASAILAALVQVLESNQGASLITQFQPIVDVLQSCFELEPQTFQDTLAHQAAVRDMTSVRRHLKYGESVEPFEIAAIQRKKNAFSFDITREGPGALSTTGQRHDNDHEAISEIKILPTAQEICSPLSEYLPIKDSASWHIQGISGLIDQQFRLLREDTVGQLRDCIHRTMESVPTIKNYTRKTRPEKSQNESLKSFTYSRVRLSDAILEKKKKQMIVVATFDQPEHLQRSTKKARETWWENTQRLQIDSLVSLVDSKGNTLFFTVFERGGIDADKARASSSNNDADPKNDNTKVPRVAKLWSDPHNATVTLRIIDMRNPALAGVLGRDWKSTQVHQVLVEFPGILLPSFKPTLEALQRMSQTHDIPFSRLLLPGSETVGTRLTWPAYATQPGFSFNLESITRDKGPLPLSQQDAFDHAALKSRTTLDDAQCNALVGALSRNLALVQGPPGTGKSYVAVQAVKVLLECRSRAKLNPIICVCYTNHALDQFLEQMLEDGVENVIRIGGQSKSSRLEPINLRKVSREIEPTKTEKRELWERNTKLEERGCEIETLLRRLKRSSQPHSLQRYLKDEYIQNYRQIFESQDKEKFQDVTKKGTNLMQQWLNMSPGDIDRKPEAKDRSLEQLAHVDLRTMSKPERKLLYDHWINTLQRKLSSQLHTAIRHFVNTDERLTKCRQEIKMRCLEKAQIIGITTSGLAQNVELLGRLRPKVLICEEAGEILEAHTLTAFLPSIEHAILIGDHEQLRPQVQNYSLSLESQQGKKFALDMSTFERIITTLDIQHETLQTQRRMHPRISNLIRQTLYPNLKDHQSVLEYPPVSGFRSRLFWLEHQKPEATDRTKTLESSHSNDYEVDVVEAMVLHLVRQGVYGAEDIVVLTPYVRQLQKLRQRLGSSFEIIIGEKDQDELAKQELDATPSGRPATHRAMLTQQLRISTVDNFQGEEAKVVVISLVRSNTMQKCGFLRTSNRINVLLSRAKHGMYIIGNSQTYEHVPMWKKVMELLRANDNIGPSISLCCPQHPDTIIDATLPADFQMRAPEGGCDLQCNLRLECGHSCTFKCHSKPRHDIVICQEPCPRTHPKCGHPCPKNCGAPCGVCLTKVPSITLPCGHVLAQLECYRTGDLKSVKCTQVIEHVVPRCNHKVNIPCHMDVLDPKFKCTAVCGANLSCGHKCRRPCHRCRAGTDGTKPNHGVCASPCGRQYTTCGHSCQAKCHGDKPCQLCDEPCPTKCRHSKCSKKCHEPCAPCAEPCDVGCQHQGRCMMPCAVPCNILPCSRRCEKMLSCGHQCPSTCGERCPEPTYCQTCAPETIKSATIDYILGESFETANLDDDPVVIPRCGHLVCRSSIDGIMDMSRYYVLSTEGHPISIRSDSTPLSEEKVKVCPQCRGCLGEINRFARVVKRAMLDESTKRFIVWSNARFVPLTSRLRNEEQRLSDSEVLLNGNLPHTTQNNPNHVHIDGRRDEQIVVLRELPGLNQRLGSTFKLRGEINRFLSKVVEDEQPFSRVYQLSRQVKQQSNDGEFEFDSSVLQTRHRLLTGLLLLRADFAILSDFLKIVQESPHRKIAFPWLGQPLSLDLHRYRTDCLILANESVQKQQPMTQVESLVHFAKFVALERKLPKDDARIPGLLDEARYQLQLARNIIADFPSTSSLTGEIEAAEKMLRESTFYTIVTSNERQAIYTAMAQELIGTGHWYYCVNLHPFTIGECGMPMQNARCPQCGAPIGGQSHQLVEGVTRATDLDEDFGRLGL